LTANETTSLRGIPFRVEPDGEKVQIPRMGREKSNMGLARNAGEIRSSSGCRIAKKSGKALGPIEDADAGKKERSC